MKRTAASTKKLKARTTRTDTDTGTGTSTGTGTGTKATKRAPSPRPAAEERIVGAARAVLSRNPGATVDDVVAASGVSRATFFRCFSNRTALLRAVATAAVGDLQQALTEVTALDGHADVAPRLSAILAVLIAHGEHLRFLASAVDLYEDPAIAAAAGEADEVIAPIIDDAVRAGILRDDLPRAWLWAATDALVFAAWHEVSVGRLARNDAARVVEDTLLAGFGRRR